MPVCTAKRGTFKMNVLFEKKDHIGYVKYNRPEAKNAFSPELITKMAQIVDEINGDNDIWVVILGSSTPGVFSAGADLKLTIPLLTGARKPENDVEQRILDDVGLFRKGTLKAKDIDRPIVAAIDGFCFGGGFEAVLSTDIRIATERSVFGLPEVTRGIAPWGGGTSKLARQVPYAKAMEVVLTGRRFSAKEMFEMGLINEVVDPDVLWERADDYAKVISSNAPLAVRAAKASIKACIGHPFDEALELERNLTAHLRDTEDAREGPRAFAEKRKPHWKAQ
jgi:enoyl-CoA hydratase